MRSRWPQEMPCPGRAQTKTSGRQPDLAFRAGGRAGKPAVAAQNPVHRNARDKSSSQVGRKVAHGDGQIERWRHPAIRLDIPCRSPKRRWSRAIPLPNPMRAGPSNADFRLSSSFARSIIAATRVYGVDRPGRGEAEITAAGVAEFSVGRKPKAASGPTSPICTEAPMPLANLPAQQYARRAPDRSAGRQLSWSVGHARWTQRQRARYPVPPHADLRAGGHRLPCNQIGGDRPLMGSPISARRSSSRAIRKSSRPSGNRAPGARVSAP